MNRGPAEQAIEELVRRLDLPGLDCAAVTVRAASRPVPAEFRLDVRDAAGDADCDRAQCERLARAIAELPEVDRAVAVPPRVYVSPTTAFLRRVVTEAVCSAGAAYGRTVVDDPLSYIVSFSGPNVNKPLHLGHLRNNVIGMALSTLLADRGHQVERQAPHCNWGIHICQALLAYRKWGDRHTPAELGVKGDHYVGRHYVLFHERCATDPDLEAEAAALMSAMEDGDQALRAQNWLFTSWADEGIQETYARIGTRMDTIFYDQNYLDDGKRIITDALAAGRCHRRDDSSVYVDLTEHGLGQVTLERRDGTPTVYRQWMAVNIARYPSRPFNQIYVVTGKEWEAGIGILRETLRAFGHEWAARMEAVHYGLVTLPDGRMRSRQGSGVSVDAVLDELRDDLMHNWCDQEGTPADDERIQTCDTLGLGLLKHHFLGVRRSREVVYDEAALRAAGQRRYAAVVRAVAWAEDDIGPDAAGEPPENGLRALLLQLEALPGVVERSATECEPAHLVRHLDDIAGHARVLARHLPPGDPARTAVSVALRRVLHLLNIDLPGRLDALPPSYAHRPAAFSTAAP